MSSNLDERFTFGETYVMEDCSSLDRYDYPAMPSILGPLGASVLDFLCKTTVILCGSIAGQSNGEIEHSAWTLRANK